MYISPLDNSIIYRYLIGARIGRGSFGECKTCQCLISKDSYAVKIIERSDAGGFWSPSAIFKREVEILISLKHENVVRYVDAMSDGRFLYLIMEKCSGGELFDKILSEKRIRENDSVLIFNQVLRAIEYIHELKIVHRDIKSENFLLSSNGLIKLIDFGLSVRLRIVIGFLLLLGQRIIWHPRCCAKTIQRLSIFGAQVYCFTSCSLDDTHTTEPKNKYYIA